jgi:hypothetical protein
VFIYQTESYHGKLPRRSELWQMKTLNRLQVQTAITPLDLGTGRSRKLPSIVFVTLSDFFSCLSGIRHSSDPLVHHGRHFGRTVYAMCNVRSLIRNTLLRLEESDGGEVSEESLTSEYIFLVNLSVPWAFISCSVGHRQSAKYFRNCRPWYPISWTVLSNQKQHSRSLQNRFEPIFYLWH